MSIECHRPISPLRQRMIEDMIARKLNPHTQRSHLGTVKNLSHIFMRRPGLVGFALDRAVACPCIYGWTSLFQRCGAGGRQPG